MRDIRQTPQYSNYLKSIGWIVEQKQGSYYFIKKFPLIGSVIKVQRPHVVNYDFIKKLTKNYRAFLIIVEPKNDLDAEHLISLGFNLDYSPYLPTKTLQIDLTDSKAQIIKAMKKDARTAINKSLNLQIEEVRHDHLDKSLDAWSKAVGIKRHVPSLKEIKALKKSFPKNCVLLQCITPESREIIAGAVFLIGDKIGYYWQAFTSDKGRKKLAQYKVVWEGILWAKKHGAKVFDFEGVYDERYPNKKWLGFTHFKRSFGGYEVEYPGCYTKISFGNML